MGKWIFALAGIAACVIGGLSANQGRIDLIGVTRVTLDAPHAYTLGRQGGLLLDHKDVLERYPIPSDADNFAAILPQVTSLAGRGFSSIRNVSTGRLTEIELKELKSWEKALDVAVENSGRSAFRLHSDYKTYGIYEPETTSRAICTALARRARIRGLQNDFDGALKDISAGMRIAHLSSLESTPDAWARSLESLQYICLSALQLADLAENEPEKLRSLQKTIEESRFEFDVKRFIELSQFASINYARNSSQWNQTDRSRIKDNYISSGLSKDARSRYALAKAIKRHLKYAEAWRMSSNSCVDLEARLADFPVSDPDGLNTSGNESLNVSPAVDVIAEQTYLLATIELKQVSNRLGRTPVSSDLKAEIMNDPRTGRKFQIAYRGNKATLLPYNHLNSNFIK